MALGFKIKRIKTQKTYTIESFYEAIKDAKFSAGEPRLQKHGAVMLIVFPALDSQNQVQITRASFKSESNSFQIQKMEEAGVNNLVKNQVKDSLTSGFFGMKKVFGANSKECERLVEETEKELNALNL